MMFGCIPYAVALILLMWPPPVLSEGDGTSLSIWFGIFYILFYLFQTLTVIPYDALGPEVTDDPDDRSKVKGFKVNIE